MMNPPKKDRLLVAAQFLRVGRHERPKLCADCRDNVARDRQQLVGEHVEQRWRLRCAAFEEA